METLILAGLLGLLFIPGLFGMLMIYHVFIRSNHYPADKSNRINHFRLVWFALTREEEFVGLFPWLKKDEWDNINNK